jgi:hypothetical protein
VSLVVLGTVESAYWEHNTGSRERVPKGFKPLTTNEAAETIVSSIVGNKRLLVRPGLLRLLFALEALAPGLALRR